MEKRKLGNSDIDVSVCCLGTMTYGEQNSEAEGHQQLDYALAHGVNFIDTAELYAIPPRPETYGKTEEIIGTWLKARGNRDKVVLASKIAGRAQMDWFRPGGIDTRVDSAQIDYAIENSLRRLQTDFIDLYQIHWPDRRFFGFGGFNYRHFESEYVAFEDTLAALARHVEKGNIRHFGVSNESAYGVMGFVRAAEKSGLPKLVSIQNAYNLVNRTFEYGLSEIAIAEQVGLLAYSPLGQGFLTGKYLNGAKPEGARNTLFNRGQRYETPGADGAIERYLEIARKWDLDIVDLALGFCASRPFMTSVIIGATTMAQLALAISAFDKPWRTEYDKDIHAAHAICPNPCP